MKSDSFGYELGFAIAEDEFGNPVQRTKIDYPYSYDGFVLHRLGENKEANGTVYSDRLYEWDNKRYNTLRQKHFGDNSQYWGSSYPSLIEKFLQDYMDNQDLKLIIVMEHCNLATGYPVWRFDYKT